MIWIAIASRPSIHPFVITPTTLKENAVGELPDRVVEPMPVVPGVI